jgi:ParB-like chromosome segregation protein Spo0J
MKMEVTYIHPDRLRPYEGNARTHTPEQVAQIAASIKEFGFTNPIICDGGNTVIAGHGRLLAAERLGLDAVPVIRLTHLSERQRRALTLADNRIGLSSGWDFERLAVEIEALADADFDIDLLGFDEQEISALLKSDAGILPEGWAGDAGVGNEPNQLEKTYIENTNTDIQKKSGKKCKCPNCNFCFDA